MDKSTGNRMLDKLLPHNRKTQGAGQKRLNTALSSQIIIRITPITSAIWIRAPRLKTNNPNSHKINNIIPTINKMPMLPPLYFSVPLTLVTELCVRSQPYTWTFIPGT